MNQNKTTESNESQAAPCNIDGVVKRSFTPLSSENGYPMTNKEFYSLEMNCERIYIKNEDVSAFKRACKKAMVRYILVSDCLKEESLFGHTAFFTRHHLNKCLFDLGRYFQKEIES